MRAAQPPQGRISYIVRLYPFGFYALEAIWMHVIALLTGSLASLFFAARLFCTALLMLGLYFNYRTALRLGVPPADERGADRRDRDISDDVAGLVVRAAR